MPVPNALQNKALKVWKAPSLSADILSTYVSGTERRKKTYTIRDHPQLYEGSRPHQLFEELRKEVLAIDPCVSEEFLKLYIAYKAETNFVDVIPQAARLKLSLEHEISRDP